MTIHFLKETIWFLIVAKRLLYEVCWECIYLLYGIEMHVEKVGVMKKYNEREFKEHMERHVEKPIPELLLYGYLMFFLFFFLPNLCWFLISYQYFFK